MPTPSRHQRRRRRGYTLVELMVTMGVVMVIASLAISNMPRMSLDMRISRAANTFAALFREARARALAKRQYVQVTVAANQFSFAYKRCRFDSQDSSDGCTAWQTIQTYRMGGSLTPGDAVFKFDGVTITAGTMGNWVFTPSGILESGPGATLYGFEATDANRRALRWNVRVTSGGVAEVNQ